MVIQEPRLLLSLDSDLFHIHREFSIHLMTGERMGASHMGGGGLSARPLNSVHHFCQYSNAKILSHGHILLQRRLYKYSLLLHPGKNRNEF